MWWRGWGGQCEGGGVRCGEASGCGAVKGEVW